MQTIVCHTGTTPPIATAFPARGAAFASRLRGMGTGSARSWKRRGGRTGYGAPSLRSASMPRALRPADQEGLLQIVGSSPRPGRPHPAASCDCGCTCRACRQRARRDRIGDRRPQRRSGGGDLTAAGSPSLTPLRALGPAAPVGPSAPAAPALVASPPAPPGPSMAVHGTAGAAGTPNVKPRKPRRRAAWIDAVPTTRRWRGPEAPSPPAAAAVAASMEPRS